MSHKPSLIDPDGVPTQESGVLSLNADHPTKVARFLRRFKGQPDKQAAFAYSSEPVYLSESSSIDGTVIHDVKDLGQANAVEDGDLRKFYEPIAAYEGRHRYDPKAQWTPQEEKRLVRRVRISLHSKSPCIDNSQLDYKICAWVCFMFFALQLDRGNISQALSDNMLGTQPRFFEPLY